MRTIACFPGEGRIPVLLKIAQLLIAGLLISACASGAVSKKTGVNAVAMADGMMHRGQYDTAAALYAQTPLLNEGERHLKLAAVALAKSHYDLAEQRLYMADQAGAHPTDLIEGQAWLLLHRQQTLLAAQQFGKLAQSDAMRRNQWHMLQAMSLDLAGMHQAARPVWADIPPTAARESNYGIHLALAEGPGAAITWFRTIMSRDNVPPHHIKIWRGNMAMMLAWAGQKDDAALILGRQDDGMNLLQEYSRMAESPEQARHILWQWLVQSRVWIPGRDMSQ